MPEDAPARSGALRPRLIGSRPTRADLLAGITVALILVPQSIAYADLAGMPPATGLLVAAAAGVPAALFASSPYLQTGPVAITALLAFGSLTPLAAPGSGRYVGLAASLALIVGLIRLGIGLTRSGALAYLMSEPVLLGFTPGAALVIIATQIADLLGAPDPDASPLIGAVEVLARPGRWSLPTLLLSAVVTAGIMLGKRLAPRAPAVLIAVVGSIGLVAAGGYDGAVVGDIPALRPILPPIPSVDDLMSLLVPGVIIAIIGFGDVAAISRTYATATRSRWDADREFVAQGVGNVAAGLVGGFPVGGSFSRSAIAFDSGARTPWTGAVASLLVIATIPATGLLARLPQATLAAIVVVSVLGLVRLRPVLALRGYSRQQFVIAVVTLVLTLAAAPRIHWALVVGIVLAIGAHLRRELRVDVPYEIDGDTVHLHPTGVLYFASAHVLLDRSRELVADADVDHVVIHLDRLGRVDVTGAFALRQLLDEAEQHDVRIEVVGATPTSRKIVQRVLAKHGVDVERADPGRRERG